MAVARLVGLGRFHIQRNFPRNYTELSRSLISIRQCSSVLQDVETFQLGDFQKDLKPFLKTRKKQRFVPEQKHYYNEDPIIKCKDKSKNHYRNQTYSKFKPVPLASECWTNYKSTGDYFTIHVYTQDFTLPERPKIKFEDANISPEIVEILRDNNIEYMSIVQENAIPIVAKGYNTLIAGEAGCGKTLAYLIPIVEHILQWKSTKQDRYNAPFVLILTPSRELTEQIKDVIQMFKPLDIKAHKIFGSSFKKKVYNPNVDDIDILVATVGAVAKFIAAGVYSLENVRHVVLDEADVLLDDSFNETTANFLKRFRFRAGPSDNEKTIGTQISLVSATMPTSISDLLGDIIEVDFFEKISTPNLHKTMPHVPQKFMRVNKSTKPAYILQIAKANFKSKVPTIIFCNDSSTCNWLALFLNSNKVENLRLNGEMDWRSRREIFKQFQDGECDILVCTSVAARGLDTCRVQHVVNYDFPVFIADYIHRCGRTGRLGSKVPGKVTNLITTKNEIKLTQKIEKAVRTMTEFENVNANIKRIIRFRGASAQAETEEEEDPVEKDSEKQEK